MANTSNSTLTTNFNVYPYYDDFDKDKNFYRILFKPGFAVQARELTQSQTMLQSQVDRLSKHLFKEGSIILPGQFVVETDIDYVKVKDTDSDTNDITSISVYEGELLTGATNNVQAYVVDTLDGTEASSDTKTLYVRYTQSSSSNTQIKKFVTGETLTANSGSNPVVIGASATGTASRFTIREGVFYAKEHLISFATQSIILDRYNSNANCRVGFDVTEEIIAASADATLLDPALESSNYAAPGADRLKLSPTLRVRELTDTTSAPDFVELFTIKNGVVTERYDRTQYNIIRDELAKRTYDESGDYYVRGLGVRVRENYDSGINGGLSLTGDTTLLSIGVEPGVGYVKGYEVNKLVTDYITTPKATDYANATSQIGTAALGNYLYITEVSGSAITDKGVQIQLYDTAAQSITNKTWDAIPSATLIGSANLASFEYNSGDMGTADATYAAYLTDIRMLGSNTFSQAKSVFINNTAGSRANLVGDIILNSSNNAVLNDTSSTLLYAVGSKAVKTTRDTSGNPATTFNFLRSTDVTIATAGTLDLTLTTSGEGEVFPYGTTSGLSDSDKREIIVSWNEDISISMGTVAGISTSTTLNAGTANFSRLNVGDKVELSGNAYTYIVTGIANASYMTVDATLPVINGNTISKVYKTGDIVDLTSVGVDNGIERVVSTTPSQLSFDLKETYGTDRSATITYQVVRTNGQEAQKLLRTSRFVKINCATSAAGTGGPYSLGFSDIFRVRSITKKTGSYPTAVGDGVDVMDDFVVWNGQRDMYYDHGTITPISPLGSTDTLLVELDYFEPSYTSGKGYFSIDSYPINDSSPTSTQIRTEDVPFFVSPRDKKIYNLRNFIDVRPIKSITAADATTVGAATINPASSGGFNFDSNGMRLPAPSTQFTYDYSYYYPRRDLVVIDQDGVIRVVKGTPAPFPITPTTPENTMALASIFVTPYPSLAPNYGKLINRPDISCVVQKMSNVRHTMREIGLLKKRIENLEYYASLSLLEKQAAELRILDENGLERFKNGFFVDNFANHQLGDTRNRNYRIVVDPTERVIRPMYTMNSIGYNMKANTNVTKTGPLLTLDYTEEVFVEQTKATSYRNVELTSYRFLGTLTLNPATDVWVDTEYAPDEHQIVGEPSANSSVTESLGIDWGDWQTVWNEWQTYVTGYEAYNSRGQLVGSYSTLSAAQKAFDDDGKYGTTLVATANSQFILNPSASFYNMGTVTDLVTTSGKVVGDFRLSNGDGVIYAIVSSSESGISTRIGTEAFVTTSIEATTLTEQIGTKVIDVSLVPYIRPQTIKIYGRGLKPRTRVYAFFDDEAMSTYARPITQTMFESNPQDPAYWDPDNFTTASEGDALVTDANGSIFCEIRLPAEKRFRVGTKEVVLTDSLTNSIDATTKAVGYFVSHGLVQVKKNTMLTTFGTTTTVTRETRTVTENKNKAIVAVVDDASCTAYSFLPKAPTGDEGLFITSVDLFFAEKHPSLGVWVEIREMDSSGGITRNQIPYSEVWLTPAEINTSANASVATNITFEAPVFLYTDVEYAFVIHTVGINPDTYLWISRLGENDISTGEQVTARPLTGTYYTTNNNMNWDIVPDIDLKIKFYRARFETGVNGTVVLGNRPHEQLTLTNVSTKPTTYGETYVGRYRMTMDDVSAMNADAGDWIVGTTSAANGVILNIASSIVTTDNIRFQTGEAVTIYYGSNGTNSGLISNISAIASGSGVLRRYKDRSNLSSAIAEFTSSNGAFVVGDVITGVDSGITATITSIKNMRFSVVDFEPSYLTFNKTNVAFEMRTTSNTGTLGNYVGINDNENYYFNSERAVLSRSNEVTSLSGAPSNNVRITMRSSTNFLSPVVDLNRTHSVYVDNIVNANTYKEDATSTTLTLSSNVANLSVGDRLVGVTSDANTTVKTITGNTVSVVVPTTQFDEGERVNFYTSAMVSKSNSAVVSAIVMDRINPGGELFNKYISIPVTLAEGQDAEDLLVLLTGYRPPTTDIKVWAKILHSEDGGTAFENLPWIELEKSTSSPYSSQSNLNDYSEFQFRFPAAQRSGDNYEVQYKNADGVTFTGFKWYAIKIGLLAENSAVIPKVGDLRVIALQI